MTNKKNAKVDADAVAMEQTALSEAAGSLESAATDLETVKSAIAAGDLAYGYSELSDADAAWRHAQLRYNGMLENLRLAERDSIYSKASQFADELLAGKDGIQTDNLAAARRRLYESVVRAVREYNRTEREHTNAVVAAVRFSDSLGNPSDSRVSHGVDEYGNLYVRADDVEFRAHRAISDVMTERVMGWALFEVREGYRHPDTNASLEITE